MCYVQVRALHPPTTFTSSPLPNPQVGSSRLRGTRERGGTVTRARGSLHTPDVRSAGTSGTTSAPSLNQWKTDSFFRLATCIRGHRQRERRMRRSREPETNAPEQRGNGSVDTNAICHTVAVTALCAGRTMMIPVTKMNCAESISHLDRHQ